MRFKNFVSVVLFILILGNVLVYSQTKSKIKGVSFTDYYYNIKNNSVNEQDRNAFTIRRAYFTFENNITEEIKIRFRLEAKNDNYGKGTKLTPFVKHAYMEWKDLIPFHKIYLGITETNAFKNVENYWGYRSIEKTIMDLNKISFSADLGIAIKGSLVDDKVYHWLTIHNGTGYGSSEVDRYKKFGYSFWITPVEGLIVEGYADYENQNPNDAQTASVLSIAKDYTGCNGYYTLKTFVGYEQHRYTIGAEFFMRTNKESGIKDVEVEQDTIISSSKADVKKFGYSIFGSVIMPLPKLKAFVRYDFYDPNTENKTYIDFSNGILTGGIDDEYTLFIAGLDYFPNTNIHFMPNVIVKSYSDSDKDSDITARVTLYYKFSTAKF